MSESAFLPADFEIPTTETPDGHLVRPLGMDDLARDYTAVMASIEHLRTSGHLQPPGELIQDWPRPDITMRFHLTMLGEAEWAMHERTRIEYGIQAADGSEQFGCLYVFPSLNPDYDAQLTMWTRADVYANSDLDARLWAYLKQWVDDVYPFERVAHPGRDLAWGNYI